MPDLREAQPGEKWEQPSNTWWRVQGHLGPDSYTAVVTCSNGHPSCIGHVHQIADDGAVTPSFICPYCKEHTFLKLQGWGSAE